MQEDDGISFDKVEATEETVRSHSGEVMGLNPGWCGLRHGEGRGSGTVIKMPLVIPTNHYHSVWP